MAIMVMLMLQPYPKYYTDVAKIRAICLCISIMLVHVTVTLIDSLHEGICYCYFLYLLLFSVQFADLFVRIGYEL